MSLKLKESLIGKMQLLLVLFLILSATVHLLVGEFNSFTFKIIIDKYRFITAIFYSGLRVSTHPLFLSSSLAVL